MFEFSKNRYTCERSLSYPCHPCHIRAQSFKQISWKMPEFWCFEGPKRPFSRYFRQFLHFFDFQNLSDLGRSKSVLGPFFTFLTINWPKNMHHSSQTQTFQFDLSSTSWPWMIDLEYAHRKLGMILRSVPDTIHIVDKFSRSIERRLNLVNPASSSWVLKGRGVKNTPPPVSCVMEVPLSGAG